MEIGMNRIDVMVWWVLFFFTKMYTYVLPHIKKPHHI